MTAYIENLVSTIIPVYNRRELLLQSVESVVNQTYRPIEIIVVDDGSDESYQEFYAELESRFDDLILLRQNNTGPGGARELGRQHARGEFIQYLDSDDVLLPNKFMAQIKELRANPSAAAAYGPSYEYQYSGSYLSETELASIVTLEPTRGTANPRLSLFPTWLNSREWITCTPLYKAKILDQVGPWANLINEEDIEYEARLASLGVTLCFVDEPSVVRLLHEGHFSWHGQVDPLKLISKARARLSLFESAKSYAKSEYVPAIQENHWFEFGESAFLLARQCARQNLQSEYELLFDVSVAAMRSKSWRHHLFANLVRVFGCRLASRIVALTGR